MSEPLHPLFLTEGGDDPLGGAQLLQRGGEQALVPQVLGGEQPHPPHLDRGGRPQNGGEVGQQDAVGVAAVQIRFPGGGRQQDDAVGGFALHDLTAGGIGDGLAVDLALDLAGPEGPLDLVRQPADLVPLAEQAGGDGPPRHIHAAHKEDLHSLPPPFRRKIYKNYTFSE